jgi:hypothetical protein
MSDNVIEFPKEVRVIMGQPVLHPRTRSDILKIVKKFLDRDDYEEILLGIMDEEYYQQLDPPLAKIVDSYYMV